MEFRILGPLEVRSDGQSVELGPPKQRALLALLLLQIDRVVSTERILEELWGDDAAGKEKALWVHISRLRSALEPGRGERGQGSVLVTRDHGYTIRADPSALDARRFEVALGEARTVLSADPAAASRILHDALGLWRGSALQDFAYEEFARTAITRLDELRLEAIETRVEADLRRGLGPELIGELTTHVDEHPLREHPIDQLMRALYRAGRQAEALRICERYRLRIGEELGLEPSPELRRLEEQILLHDERLAPLTARPETTATASPFKGLHAFQAGDAEDFFGRDRLVADVVTRIGGGTRLVALVGPSGSGKSSVARAGVVPAIHKGALPGSEGWLVASMVPGAHPFAELEASLLRSTIDAPNSLDAQLADPALGLLRAALRLLPDDRSRLVLVIDQFEELFTLVADEAERRRFITNLVTAIDDPRGRVLVVLTLRADAYHLPLAHGAFAQRLGPGVVNVLPLTTDELEEAATEPAARRRVACEPALLAQLLTDVIGEPGALPIFQYALTELFDRRVDDRLTLDDYRSMGGAHGVLSRRADDVYHRLTLEEQDAARQLFLRLTTITDQETWSRRRVPASEILATDVDVVTMESVIDQLGRQRFLAFDRDQASGAPTVEVAHEALLTGWDRLRGWIEEGRADIARRGALDAALTEWSRSAHDTDYLLSGKRLAEYERWRDATAMRLTTAERDYLDASVARRDAEVAAERERVARETGLARRARRSFIALASSVTFAVHDAAFLAGAAAALTSTTGIVGYLGGFQCRVTEQFRAGFEAGAQTIDPAIEIVAEYVSLEHIGDSSGFRRDDLAREAATGMYQRGADVVLHAAGFAGGGIFPAAREQSAALGRHLWAIGADADQYFDVSEAERAHVLTSTITGYNYMGIHEIEEFLHERSDEGVRDYLDGNREPFRLELTLADEAVGYSTSGDHLSQETIYTLEAFKAQIMTGALTVPRAPSGALQPPASVTVAHTTRVTFDGSRCLYDGPATFLEGDVVHVEFVNNTDGDAMFAIYAPDFTVVQIPAVAGGRNEGYGSLGGGRNDSWCTSDAGEVPGPTFDAG